MFRTSLHAATLTLIALSCSIACGGDEEDPEPTGDGDAATGGMTAGDGDTSGDGDTNGDGDTTPNGPCGDRVGVPTVDGVLQAADDSIASAERAQEDFAGALAEMETIMGLQAGGTLSARVNAVIAVVQAEIAANTEGLWVHLPYVECSSSRAATAEAQISCEETMCGATSQVAAADLALECTGICQGECLGSCGADAAALCVTEVTGALCEGTCEGKCELSAAGACEGLCIGTCVGTCSETDESGCIGSCDGTCEGTCTTDFPLECAGDCTGHCSAETGLSCSGIVECDGSCDGECAAGCEGEFGAATAIDDCEFSAECQPQARALGSAAVGCTESTIRTHYEFAEGVDSEARAAFNAKMARLEPQFEAALNAFQHLNVLLTGEVNGVVRFETAPIEVTLSVLVALIDAGTDGDLLTQVAPEQLSCVLPAFESSISRLGDTVGESVAPLAAQGQLAAAISSGFAL